MKTYIFLLLMFVPFSVFSQNGKIKGTVYDAVSNEPLSFASVNVFGTNIATTTDSLGQFLLTKIPNEFVRLQVSMIGYEKSLSPEILVTNAKIEYIEIRLQSKEKQTNEVSVRAVRFNKTDAPISTQTLNLSEIESNPGSNRDIVKVIQSLPGVGSTAAFRNDILIRGGGPNENRFYLDGVEIPTINHFATQGASGGAVSIINSDFISSVNFYSGSFPSNNGNALSSVFEFSQKEGNKERPKFRASLGASETSLTADAPIGKKTTMVFSVRQSYLQLLFKTLKLPFLPTFNDYQMKVHTNINTKNELTFISIGSLDKSKLNLDIKNPTEEQRYILGYLPEYYQWNYTAGLVWKHFREKSSQTFVVSRNMLNNESYKYQDNDYSKSKTLDYVSQEIENKFRFENVYENDGYKLSTGFNGEYVKYNNHTQRSIFTANELVSINYKSDLELFKGGVFAQATKIFDRFKVDLGLRTDVNTYSASMQNPLEQLSPRLSLSYKLTEKSALNFNTGKYFQLPAYTSLGYRNSEGVLVNKENKLKYIGVTHVVGGWEYHPNDVSLFTVESFYKQYSKYPFSVEKQICLANEGGDFGAVGDEQVISTGEGRAYGVEFLLRLRTSNGLSLITAYTLSKSEYKDLKGDYQPSAWDSRHILTLTATQNLPNKWTVGAKWRFLSGLPYTPYDLATSAKKDAWDTQNRPFYDYQRLNSERLSAFHQLDIRVDKKYFFERWSLMFYVDIQNVYNLKYKNPDNYTIVRDANGNAVYADAAQSIYQLKAISSTSGTILPTIGIMIEF